MESTLSSTKFLQQLKAYTYTKSDGRQWIQYHRQENVYPHSEQRLVLEHTDLYPDIYLEMQDEGLVRGSDFSPPTLRYNEMRDEWVAISASRNNRPFLPPDTYCPLCPVNTYVKDPQGNLCKTDVPVMSRAYEWAVMENLFPGLGHGNQTGHCEVILYTPEHRLTLAQCSLGQLAGLIGVWQHRSREVGKRPEIKQVFIFENKGIEVGVTLHHPHGQLYAMTVVPPVIAREHQVAEAYYHQHGHCIVCATAMREALGPRLVARTEHLVAYVPEAARYPYELHITTLTHRPLIEDLSLTEVAELAQLLKEVLIKYNNLMGFEFPYIMAHHQVSHKSSADQHYHWHIEFYPPYRAPAKLKFLAGVESGTGMFINDTIPEHKALELVRVKGQGHLIPALESGLTLQPQCTSADGPTHAIPALGKRHFSVWAPGRVNLIGEHTDYNGGKVMPFAFSKGIKLNVAVSFEMSPLADCDLEITSETQDLGFKGNLSSVDTHLRQIVAEGKFGPNSGAPDLREMLFDRPQGPQNLGQSWLRYPLGACFWQRWEQIFAHESDGTQSQLGTLPRSIKINVDSDLPAGAGVSSSAALSLGFLRAFASALGSSDISVQDLVRRAMWIEHQFSGTRCGLMDQIAIALAQPESYLMIDFKDFDSQGTFATKAIKPHAMFDQYKHILINSKVHHDLGSSPYNQRRSACEFGLTELNRVTRLNLPSLGHYAENVDFIAKYCPNLSQSLMITNLSQQVFDGDQQLAQRVGHAIMETRRVDLAARALQMGDLGALSAVMNGSHESLAKDYEVSCDEIEILRDQVLYLGQQLNQDPRLRSLPAVLGSRMTGGGFGGCLIQLVHHEVVAQFVAGMVNPTSSYAKSTGMIPEAFVVDLGGGLKIS